METGTIDIFATKGLEYLIVIGYLVLLVAFWQLLRRPTADSPGNTTRTVRVPGLPFTLRADVGYHQGHGWARPIDGSVVRVGLDDFARQLLGEPQRLVLPPPGTRLAQGERGWDVVVDETPIGMLSPVDGEVIGVNPALATHPGLVAAEPYDGGWLLDVRVAPSGGTLKNLLRGDVAQTWLRQTAERIRAMGSPELGVLLPDGGMPVAGLARALAADRWAEVARELLLSGPPE